MKVITIKTSYWSVSAMQMFYLFLIPYSLFLLILYLKNLKWGIFWVIFTLPVYLIRFSAFGLPMTLLEGSILLLFLVFLIKNIKTVKSVKTIKKLLITNYYLLITITLFLLAATISLFISPNLRAALGIWKAYFIEPILFLVVFINTIKRGDLKNIFKILCLSVFLLSVFSVYQKFTGAFISNQFWSAEATRRVTSVFPYPNALALYLAPVVVMLIGWFVSKCQSVQCQSVQCQRNKKKFIPLFLYSFIPIILGILAIYFTKSKGALFAILAGVIFYAIFYKGHRKIFIGILICVLVFLCFSVFVNGLPNLTGTPTVEGGDSISTRVEMWQETWQMLKTRPILGAGLAGYQTAVALFHQKDYIEIYLYPHNIILNFWSEIGLLGLLAFIGIIFWFYKTGFRKLRVTSYELRVTIMASMTALLVHGIVDVPYFKNDLAILFWIIVGMMLVLNKKEDFNNKIYNT